MHHKRLTPFNTDHKTPQLSWGSGNKDSFSLRVQTQGHNMHQIWDIVARALESNLKDTHKRLHVQVQRLLDSADYTRQQMTPPEDK